MRIRKNAKLSPLFFSFSSSSQGGSFPVQTHVCQLNQSPWDVIPFDSDSIQFEGEDSVTAGNGAGDSILFVESVASMPRVDDMVMVDDNHTIEIDNNCDKVVAKASCCEGFDAKGWPCKNEPKDGQSFCRHHLSSKKAVAAAARRGARARAAKKSTPSSSSSNPYEFYYYSGFGPLWGKQRGGNRNGGEERNNSNGAAEENSPMMESENTITTTTLSSDNTNGSVVLMDNNKEGFDYVDDNDEEEDDANDDSGKKRMRKPVKARSLKSLM
ncbi:unnamed protein product [Lupinus luteus]|uniref:WRC domain-containing protein n=1 Tax=Lupinus luteus TaxID=3873 RepID=A0AAV1WHA1_LUPLU